MMAPLGIHAIVPLGNQKRSRPDARVPGYVKKRRYGILDGRRHRGLVARFRGRAQPQWANFIKFH